MNNFKQTRVYPQKCCKYLEFILLQSLTYLFYFHMALNSLVPFYMSVEIGVTKTDKIHLLTRDKSTLNDQDWR